MEKFVEMEIRPKDNGLFIIRGIANPTKVSDTSSIDSLKSASEEDGNFNARLLYSKALMNQNMVQEACQIRLDSSIELLQSIDDDDEIEFDLKDSNTLSAIEIMSLSSLDHYLICDFDMAISLGETALELNPEDTDNVVEILAYSYAMTSDKSAVQDILPFLQNDDREKELILAICDFNSGKKIKLSETLKASLQDENSELNKKNAHLWLIIPNFKKNI